MRDYAKNLELRHRTRVTNRSGYIATLGRRAEALYHTRVTTTTATQSASTHEISDNNPSPAQ